MPRPNPDCEQRREQAYKELNILSADVRLAAPISSQLRLLGRSLKKLNLPDSPYYYLKCSNAPEAIRVIELYYSLAKCKRELVPIEAYCVAAAVHPLILLNVITKACQQVTSQTSAMIAAISHPRVVEKTVAMALTDDGEADRMVLHKATGFIPTPRGPQTNINLTQNASAQANAQAGLYLEDLYVKPAMRGKGVGMALLSQVARIARERDFGRVEWGVLDWNEPSIQFYKRLGAVPMDEWTKYRLAGEALEKLAGRGEPPHL